MTKKTRATLTSDADSTFVTGGATTAVQAKARVTDMIDSMVLSNTITDIVTLTQAEYDALTPDENTLYVITD